MTTSSVYNVGLDRLGPAWLTSPYKALLVDSGGGYTFDKDHATVSAISFSEVAVGGYSRPTITTPTRTVDNALDRITYDADDPGFGSIAAGTTVQAMVLFLFVTSDADSIPIAYYPFTPTILTDGSPFPVTIPAAGFLYTDQGP